MTRCTCTVFSRNGESHSLDCPKRQAYEQRKQHTTSSERKAAKKERIKAMVGVLRPERVVDEQLMALLGVNTDE